MTHEPWWEVKILSKLQVPSFHAYTHILSDRGDTCSTSATLSHRQQDLEEKDEIVTKLIMTKQGVCRTALATQVCLLQL